MNLLKDSVLGLLSEVVLVGDVDDRLQGGAADERLPWLLEHPETLCFNQKDYHEEEREGSYKESEETKEEVMGW